MHILHIANSYGGTEVYTQLLRSLDQLGVKQTVFVPLNPRNKDRYGSKLIDFTVAGSRIIYSGRLKSYHRYLYDTKIDTIVREIEKHVNVKEIDLFHGGLAFSDGAAAYELSRIYNIPYMVAVRNTDVNTYYKKMWWKRPYFHRILSNAKKIVFLSHKYMQDFLDQISKSEANLADKSIVLPNGLDSFFLENRCEIIKSIHEPVRVIYAGAINRGKNIVKTIEALDLLIRKGYNMRFTIIGKGLKNRKPDTKYLNSIFEYCENRPWIDVLDSMSKENLRVEFLKSDIFVMPSTPETFGIVYLEALSQGLPIIFAKGQGFDGYFEDGYIGFGVYPSNSQDIADKIESIINDYHRFASNVNQLNLEDEFSWGKISEKYFELYKNIKK